MFCAEKKETLQAAAYADSSSRFPSGKDPCVDGTPRNRLRRSCAAGQVDEGHRDRVPPGGAQARQAKFKGILLGK
jgi:hypothetical protein